MTHLILHVNRVVLRGVEVNDPQSFAAGLQEELARVLATRSTVAVLTSNASDNRQRNTIKLPHEATARQIGICVARGVSERLGS